MDLRLISGYTHKENVKALFAEYTDMLVERDPAFRDYLSKQNYDEEVEHLEEKYGQPYGRLYLAYIGGALAGCVALRRIDAQNCEMKRLYVRPEFRGQDIGGSMVRQIIRDAKHIGYSHILLDTLPFLEKAIEMYKRYGFYEIPSYNGSPMEGLVYLKMDL